MLGLRCQRQLFSSFGKYPLLTTYKFFSTFVSPTPERSGGKRNLILFEQSHLFCNSIGFSGEEPAEGSAWNATLFAGALGFTPKSQT